MTLQNFPDLEAAVVMARERVTDINRRGALAGSGVTMDMRLDRPPEPGFVPATRRRNGRHFVFTFHDSTFECVAKGLSTSLESGKEDEITAGVVRRVLAD